MTPQNENRKDLRKELTEKIIKELENGNIPWEKPWISSNHNISRPINAMTQKPYQGGNAVNLYLTSFMKGYNDPRWCTFNQAKDQGWQVKKGEKGTLIEFWKFHDEKLNADDKNEKSTEKVERKRPIVMHYYLFNANQIDGVPKLEVEFKNELKKIELAEKILKNSQAHILHGPHDRAFYNPGKDEIHLPHMDRFLNSEGYYATALHELGHWTGHSSRLNRNFKGPFGSNEYAKEELRAELASSFLSLDSGIKPNIGQHAAYINSWIKVLKEDKNEIFRAARDAEQITEYILAIPEISKVDSKMEVHKSNAKNHNSIEVGI